MNIEKRLSDLEGHIHHRIGGVPIYPNPPELPDSSPKAEPMDGECKEDHYLHNWPCQDMHGGWGSRDAMCTHPECRIRDYDNMLDALTDEEIDS